MARGNQREKSREKNLKAAAAAVRSKSLLYYTFANMFSIERRKFGQLQIALIRSGWVF